eukprot:4108148-Karenia_brevis.AAC.1
MSAQWNGHDSDTVITGSEESDCQEQSEQSGEGPQFLSKQCHYSYDNEPLYLNGDVNGELFCSTRNRAGPKECRDVRYVPVRVLRHAVRGA